MLTSFNRNENPCFYNPTLQICLKLIYNVDYITENHLGTFLFQEFPNRQHCSDCYSNQLFSGGKKQSEFNLDKVIQFLTELYSEENLSMRGLRISSDKHHAAAHSQHEVA